jgi:hypothetical protein
MVWLLEKFNTILCRFSYRYQMLLAKCGLWCNFVEYFLLMSLGNYLRILACFHLFQRIYHTTILILGPKFRFWALFLTLKNVHFLASNKIPDWLIHTRVEWFYMGKFQTVNFEKPVVLKVAHHYKNKKIVLHLFKILRSSTQFLPLRVI